MPRTKNSEITIEARLSIIEERLTDLCDSVRCLNEKIDSLDQGYNRDYKLLCNSVKESFSVISESIKLLMINNVLAKVDDASTNILSSSRESDSICPKCGKRLENDVFCVYCGFNNKKNVQPAAKPQSSAKTKTNKTASPKASKGKALKK